MTSDRERALDAAYKPFPMFVEWTEKTAVTDSRWERYRQELDSYPKEQFSAFAKAREIAQRVAAFDTGAIEGLYETDRGFTYSVAFEIGAWQAALDAKGGNVRSLFEAQLTAYESLLDLATRTEHLSEAAIRTLHGQIVSAQDTYTVHTPFGPQQQELPKGRYKIYPNHVRTRDDIDHSYSPVEMTPAEMNRLVEELRSEAFQNAHPVQQAAYAHYALACIHPFADGNGRVARALASIYSLRALSLPTVILSEAKEQYLSALHEADTGNFQALLDFMMNAMLDTIRLVSEDIKREGGIHAEQTAERIKGLYRTRSGFSEVEIDAAAERLQQVLLDALDKKARTIRSDVLLVMINKLALHPSQPLPGNHYRRTFNQDGEMLVSLQSEPPNAESLQKIFEVFVPRNAATDSDILFAEPSLKFEARPNELLPTVSAMLRLRATVFADRVFETMLNELEAKIQERHGIT